MINSKKIFNILKNNINFFTGVPDSVLKEFLKFLPNKKKNHLISVNEGTAVSHAIGYYLATKKIALVYMQNSGLGNAINPLISIANEKVYQIPMCILLGWRGSPNKKDEPQHLAMGKITLDLLKLLKIKYVIINNNNSISKIKKILDYSKKRKKIICIIIKKDSLSKNKVPKIRKKLNNNNILRLKFIENLLKFTTKKYKIVSTTGYTSRELYYLRKNKKSHIRDFYMVGGMGHASSVALGLSSFLNYKKIICLDGDGSILMHLGSMHTIGVLKNPNFKHIILNNNSHESVGGQGTEAQNIDFMNLSKSVGYKNYFILRKKNEINKILKKFLKSSGPSLLEVKIISGTIKDLMRPKNLKKQKEKFLDN